MPAPTRPPMARTPAARAFYLGRPAAWWLAALGRPHQDPARVGQQLSPGREAGQ
jgi:hypothetical protein